MGLFQPSTVRILLLTSQGLSAYIWQGGVLAPTGWFPTDEAGLAEFNHYLTSPPDCPLYLVADVIEEDFRLEDVAHVLGKDRRALLERKLAQFFRTTDYRAAQVQGREESGRRDDKVLFSALTNNEQLAFWVNRILAQHVPLKGILSVPWLMELCAGYQQLGRVAHLLLVHLEQHSGLRQTYIQNGRLKFSRLISLATVRSSNLAETITAECNHTRQYLERLKLLSRDQPLEIHLSVQGEIGEEIGEELTDRAGLSFHLHEIGVVAAELGVDPVLAGDQGMVFLALAQILRVRGLFNIYGSASATRYYRLRQIRQGLIVGTSLFFAAVLAFGFSLLADGFKQQAAQNRLDREAKQFYGQYQSLLQELPETPIPAQVMQKVVKSVGMIQRQMAYPAEMMGFVSQALAVCPEIRLLKLDWKLAVTPVSEAGEEETPVTEQPVASGGDDRQTVPALLLGMLAGKARVTTVLDGVVAPGHGYLGVQESVNRFVAALEQIPGLKVTPVVMPTETSPDISIQATLNDEAVKSEFSLQLVYQLRQGV